MRSDPLPRREALVWNGEALATVKIVTGNIITRYPANVVRRKILASMGLPHRDRTLIEGN